jgi:hypothetical protein
MRNESQATGAYGNRTFNEPRYCVQEDGRIIFQQGGPEPLDAYRSFLEEQHAAGYFKIVNEALAAEFWRCDRDDSIRSFFGPGRKEEAQAFVSQPWWTQ